MTTNKNSNVLSERELLDLYVELTTYFGAVMAASKVDVPDRVAWELVGALSRVFDMQWRRAGARGHLVRRPKPAIASFLKMLRSLEAQLREELDEH